LEKSTPPKAMIRRACFINEKYCSYEKKQMTHLPPSNVN